MTSAIYQELSERAAVIYEKVVMWRRDFHRYPELAGHEERTSGLVAEHLRALGLEVAEHVGGFGVVGLLRGEAGNGPVIGFRADMDALPLQEQTGFPYASKIPGAFRVILESAFGFRAAAGRHARVRSRRAYGDAHGNG